MQTTFLIEVGFWVKGLIARCYKDHVSRKRILDRMGMTLRSLQTYGYIDSKTKSYQIQRKFLLLFIFLPSRSWHSGCIPSNPIFPVVYFQNFCIFGGTHHSPKPSLILDLFYNLNPYLLSFSLTPKRLTSLTAIGLTKHQRAVVVASNKSCLLPPI